MSNGLFCQTDNATLTYYEQSSVNSSAEAQVDTTMFDSYDGTDLNVYWTSSPSYSGGAETDVIYQVSTSGFSGNVIGQTWCDDAVSSTRCDQVLKEVVECAENYWRPSPERSSSPVRWWPA